MTKKKIDEIRKIVIPFLAEKGVNVEKSISKDFNWFVSSPADEIPEEADCEQQEFGTHLQTDEELIEFARDEFGYITDDEVFGPNY